jgi:hypothetical protein
MDDFISPEFSSKRKRLNPRRIGNKAIKEIDFEKSAPFYVPPEQIEAIKANNLPVQRETQESIPMLSDHETQLKELDEIRPYLDDRDWRIINEGLNAGTGNLYQLMKKQYDNKREK